MPFKTQSQVETRMSLYDLTQTAEFGHLSPKMAVWIMNYVQHFIDTGTFDPLAATMAAYSVKNEENGRILGYQLLGNLKIITVLNRFFGRTPEQSFLKQVERAIHKRKLTVAQVTALRFYAELNGWSSGINWPDSSKTKIADALGGSEPSTDSQPNAEASPHQVPADALEVFTDPVSGVTIGFRAANGEAVKL